MQDIQTRHQLAAIATLRWRLFRNSLTRRGATGELAARIIAYPILAIFAIGPIIASGVAGYFIIANHSPAFLPVLLWAITTVWLFLSINFLPAAATFDPAALIRFPLNFPAYLAVRVFFGLLSIPTVVGSLALLSAATGIGLAEHSLFPIALSAFAALALSNIFLVRMAFAWIDRWLATRRAREIFTGLFFFFAITIQIASYSLRDIATRAASHASAMQARLPILLTILHRIQAASHVLPPGRAAAAVLHLQSSHTTSALLAIPEILAFATLFLAIFALRLGREYRGENLSETAAISPPTQATTRATIRPASRSPARTIHTPAIPGLNPIATAVLRKELLYLRRSGALLYAQLTPLVLVYFFTLRGMFFGRNSLWIFPSALAYILISASTTFYNSLGQDLAGVQFYFLAPIRIRDVMLGKNLITFALILLQAALVYVVITLAGKRPTPTLLVASLLWAAASTLINASVGNHRSITAPKRVLVAKVNNRQGSQLSGLISLGVLLAGSTLGALVLLLATLLHHLWIAIPIFAALAVAACNAYTRSLNHLDATTQNHREALAEELCKT